MANESLRGFISSRATSLRAFAKNIGRSRPTVYDWLHENRQPTVDSLVAIYNAYGSGHTLESLNVELGFNLVIDEVPEMIKMQRRISQLEHRLSELEAA